MKSFFSDKHRFITLGFFLVFFIAGVLVFQDYGLGWDDEWSRNETGLINYNYLVHGAKDPLVNGSEKYHGPFFEIILVALEKVSAITDTSTIYKMRHFVSFLLFFVSVIAFYKASLKIMSPAFSLLACVFLVLSPRIFAESFYNSKDMAVLAFFNLCLWSYLSFFEKRNITWAIFHGMFTGFLIATRIVGIVMPVLTIVYFMIIILIQKEYKKPAAVLLVYVASAVLCTIACWPVLQEGPLYHFGHAFAEMKRYQWDSTVLYNGTYVKSFNIPWHYIPVWIFMTTPFLYILLFLAGLWYYVRNAVSGNFLSFITSYKINSILTLLLLPVLSVILLHSVVYDSWRHLYFIYPAFIIIAIWGLKKLMQSAEHFKLIHTALHYLIILNCVYIVLWMIKNHPYENVYFNTLSRTIAGNMEKKFECDYWGLSYKQGLEYVLRKDKNQKLQIGVDNAPGILNELILPNQDRERVEIHLGKDTAYDYFITNYRWTGIPDLSLEKQIIVDGIPILGIYKK